WAGSGASASVESALDSLVDALAGQRSAAKAEKDFATADAIRDNLASAGIVIEDTADGYRYHVKDS
ncbi:MAG: CysS/YqeB C-terminal domain-containing protein, partial [Brevibacterium aurantiacum]